MFKIKHIASFLLAGALLCACSSRLEPVDYVNPYMGGISHLLVPTYPTVHLPEGMLRVYPERDDYAADRIKGLPVMVTSHRGSSAFNLGVCIGEERLRPVTAYSYDAETIRPYRYEVTLDSQGIDVKYAPSSQSAIYEIDFPDTPGERYVSLNSRNGGVMVLPGQVRTYQKVKGSVLVYVCMECDTPWEASGILDSEGFNPARQEAYGGNACAVLRFPEGTRRVRLRYGVSFISEDQAAANLHREIRDYDLEKVSAAARKAWNKALGSIEVKGGSLADKRVFYTSLYRVFERPICISEDGKYYSAYDGNIHDDAGEPFYTDDWVWDTYRAAHPLRILIEPVTETHILNSYLRMASQSGKNWLPTFPEVTGDSHRMNCNHGIIAFADASAKGLEVDLPKAFEYSSKALHEKTLCPWVGKEAGKLDEFYWREGYMPALREGEAETDPNVHKSEKRQSVAVTQGTSYDCWALSRVASAIGREEDESKYLEHSYDYRNLYRPSTGFFHPKDSEGKWIEPFDYRFSGGFAARDYYDENNGWVYRWGVQHNPADMIRLMGGREKFIAGLDRTFSEPLGKRKRDFYALLPDQTGNVGQFSMANEPAFHIPYLYIYAGAPWKTQKRIRTLLKTWFRDDVMGVPGDEDGGGMSAFVVFSMLGFYPEIPGIPAYCIGSPVFEKAVVHIPGGGDFRIEAEGASERNKYIQSASLNGKPLDRAWFNHSEIASGGVLKLKMGPRPNKIWASSADSVPPSADDK